MNDKNAPLEEPQKPDDRVLAAIFYEYALIIHQYVVRFCHDPMEAERIFGDVFVQFLEKIAIRKRPPSDPRIPLYRIAYDTIPRHVGASVQKPPTFIKSLLSQEEEGAIKAASLSALNRELT